MIITGMALNTIGQLEVKQLTQELQEIVKNHRSVFDAARTHDHAAIV